MRESGRYYRDRIGESLVSDSVCHCLRVCPVQSLYRKPKPVKVDRLPLYYGVHLLTLALGVYLCIGGMRGGFTGMVRPITISNANKYVDRPMETGIVLNTPFSIFRTFGKTSFAIPQYFDKEKMEALYTPCTCLQIVYSSDR